MESMQRVREVCVRCRTERAATSSPKATGPEHESPTSSAECLPISISSPGAQQGSDVGRCARRSRLPAPAARVRTRSPCSISTRLVPACRKSTSTSHDAREARTLQCVRSTSVLGSSRQRWRGGTRAAVPGHLRQEGRKGVPGGGSVGGRLNRALVEDTGSGSGRQLPCENAIISRGAVTSLRGRAIVVAVTRGSAGR